MNSAMKNITPADQRFWLREVILYGDEEPWLAGRTLVPESTLNGPEAMLQQLGTRPLGRYLFSSSTLTRDFIEPAALMRSGDAARACDCQETAAVNGTVFTGFAALS